MPLVGLQLKLATSVLPAGRVSLHSTVVPLWTVTVPSG